MAAFLQSLKGTNWKTTVSGIVAALFGFVLFSPEHFQQWPWLISLAKYACAGGLAAMGLVGKDFNTHSTTPQVKEATVEANAAIDTAAEAQDKHFR